MNSTQAKKISIVSYLKSCGIEPEKISSGKAYYLSPIRLESSPSFKVDLNKNVWVDYGTGKGGNIIDLCMQMNRVDVAGALSLLSKMDHFSFFSHQQEHINNEIIIKHKQTLQNRALIQYLESRKINIEVAKIYLHEVYFESNKKKYFALCFMNDRGGFELRNKYFKGSTSPKHYTTVQGQNHNSLNLFEGFFDFLSALTYYKTTIPGNDTIILNSLAFVDKVLPILLNYTKINLYMDNDTAGTNAAQNILKQHSRIINQSEKLFSGCKDFNDFLCSI
jgi:DNA primase